MMLMNEDGGVMREIETKILGSKWNIYVTINYFKNHAKKLRERPGKREIYVKI